MQIERLYDDNMTTIFLFKRVIIICIFLLYCSIFIATSPTTETKHAQQKSELSSACWQKQGNIGGMEAKKARVKLCAQFDTPFRKQTNTRLLQNQSIKAARQLDDTLPTAHRKSVDEVMRQLERNLSMLSGDRRKRSDLVDVTSQLSRRLNSFRNSFEGSNYGVRIL